MASLTGYSLCLEESGSLGDLRQVASKAPPAVCFHKRLVPTTNPLVWGPRLPLRRTRDILTGLELQLGEARPGATCGRRGSGSSCLATTGHHALAWVMA